MAEVLTADPGEVLIDDDASQDEQTPPIRYNITSYGADYDVEGLVRRIKKNEILIPEFQRQYVWKLPEASRFIESLLLGLPVPGIFLAREPETNKFLVIDGQQRLKTLYFFYEGVFNPKPADQRQRVFSLTNVQPRFEGLTYENLLEPDRLRLDNAIIHATIVKQESPPGEDSSIYHIFERLNSGGTKLAPQEIRSAIYHGKLMSEIRDLNNYAPWRAIFGNPNPRLKDQELILRFFALLYSGEKYQSPMKEFLNRFAETYKKPDDNLYEEFRQIFCSTIDLAISALGQKAFRLGGAINAAIYDSVMVGLATRLRGRPSPDISKVETSYHRLLQDEEYLQAVSRSTANEASVQLRLSKASAAFEGA